jgi:hypothetical protein
MDGSAGLRRARDPAAPVGVDEKVAAPIGPDSSAVAVCDVVGDGHLDAARANSREGAVSPLHDAPR